MRFLGSLFSGRKGQAAQDPSEYATWMGWKWDREQRTLEGRFRSPYCAPKGRLERHADGTFDLYIVKPPAALLSSAYAGYQCFPWDAGKGAHRVHFHPPATGLTIDGAIQTVERELVKAWEVERKGGKK
ncbi:MAG: hypothetical protein M3361_20480 [Candidatus Tectomicrobia bacterium]|nr:hypothetical protein [Candidatus Tectomicrobia bacterium]